MVRSAVKLINSEMNFYQKLAKRTEPIRVRITILEKLFVEITGSKVAEDGTL